MENPKIQQTTDYGIFKKVPFNRQKDKNHVKELQKIILKENLLHLHPILINEKMEIIDGQHRLEAAEALGLPIFYIQGELSYDHILNSNLFQRKLNLTDVIKFYAIKDVLPEYKKMIDLMEMLQISPKAFLGLLFGTSSKPVINFIKTGKFSFPDDTSLVSRLISVYANFMEFVKLRHISPLSMFKSAYFTTGFRILILSDNFNEKTFSIKLEKRWFDLKPQVSAKEWAKLLIEIYNWKNQSPLEFVTDAKN